MLARSPGGKRGVGVGSEQGASKNGTQPSSTACQESCYLRHSGEGGGSASGIRRLSCHPGARWPPPQPLASDDAVPARAALPMARPSGLGHWKTHCLGHCAQHSVSHHASPSLHLTSALPACRRPSDGLYLAHFQNARTKGIWETHTGLLASTDHKGTLGRK